MASSNKNRQPSPAEQDEHRPLLRSGSHTVGSTSDASSSPQPIATATPASSRRRRNLIISAVLILLSSNLVTVLVDTAGNQLVEGAACKQLHPEVQDWYKDPICKSLDVQDRLALITGYEFTWALIPGLILAIPYGVFTDHYGPRAMMVLIALGGFITQATYLTVTQYPDFFDLRWIWGCAAIGSVVGGGSVAWQAMLYTVADMIATKGHRAEFFFYMQSTSVLFMVLGGPLVYWAMNIGPVFTQSLGIFLFFVETLLSFTLPSGLANGEPVKEIADKTSAWQSVAQAFRASGDGVSGFGRLFSQNKQLSFLLISVIFSTIGLRQSGIRQQYATHRYGWSWATAGLMVSVTSIATLFIMLVLVPVGSRYLLKTHTTMGKDIIIARFGILALALGSLFIGLARTSGQFIAALIFYMAEMCYNPAITSIISAMAGVDTTQSSRSNSLFMAIVFMDNIGGLVAGPIISSLLRVGMDKGGDWVGLPFFFEAGLQLITISIVFSLRESRYKKIQAERGDDVENAPQDEV